MESLSSDRITLTNVLSFENRALTFRARNVPTPLAMDTIYRARSLSEDPILSMSL